MTFNQLDDAKEFKKVKWSIAFMYKREIEGEEFGCRGKTLEEFKDMGVSNKGIVAILHNPLKQSAMFLTHLEGTVSLKSKKWPAYTRYDFSNSQAWPIYIRKDLLDKSWGVGSYVTIPIAEKLSLQPRQNLISLDKGIFHIFQECGK